MFKITIYDGIDKFVFKNIGNWDDVYINYYIAPQTSRNVSGCVKEFSLTPVDLYYAFFPGIVYNITPDDLDGQKAKSSIKFKIAEGENIKVQNDSSHSFTFTCRLKIGLETNLEKGDLIRHGDRVLFTVEEKSNEGMTNGTIMYGTMMTMADGIEMFKIKDNLPLVVNLISIMLTLNHQ